MLGLKIKTEEISQSVILPALIKPTVGSKVRAYGLEWVLTWVAPARAPLIASEEIYSHIYLARAEVALEEGLDCDG